MEVGVISMGIQCPIIKEGDNLQQIIVDSIFRSTKLNDGDVIGITESVVARAEGNYVTVDDIAKETIRLFGENAEIKLLYPIYSRNRFSIILKGIARGCKKVILHAPKRDEVGNPFGVNPWTGVDIEKYYRRIVEAEDCKFEVNKASIDENILICSLHNQDNWKPLFKYPVAHTLADYFTDKCKYGLLGSNKASEEKLKLFPSEEYANKLVNDIKDSIYKTLNVNVEVMIYGDGCFKDPDSGIWEFADPVTSPAYTDGLNGSPNEIKLKAFADDKYKDLKGKELETAIKDEIKSKEANLKGTMVSQGTTPRRYVNLLASLMDLTSGSGDKGTPVVVVKNYFKNYANA